MKRTLTGLAVGIAVSLVGAWMLAPGLAVLLVGVGISAVVLSREVGA